ncbi:TorD/DmsD family molecular chaperone [Propionibacterium freudenreichii]|uniref:TorD/DmsD family molecular chaperone n=1 Tax=Propionibacterium freudenreichii TaxID=1744 RepID=UPI0005D76861|nr:molecular chaperone TorD family protein [Propionibacterium freudenreichii]AJQ91670.1 Cytoplasmic chaperone TorD [Propionibacterium freudenreichii subsp. freudenreichii]MDK9655982.1 molecular chaperone TorD family protein [Propionibacterium freudenreichii]SBN59192.1 Cytoplasmic chaperone TorD [Propionibacterium freudenreichii]SCQ47450.1 Cytoplasmic chaperone TorD [Propionibacterium freudenreichii]SCQ51073.1 Cytoplasmic chaperone TorD [Propionibacterium freudenreichii]
MLDAATLDSLAAAFAALGRLHREAPDETALRGFRDLIEDWPLAALEPEGKDSAAGPSNAGPSNAGPSNAGPSNAGLPSAGLPNSGSSSAGPSNPGPSNPAPAGAAAVGEAGTADASTRTRWHGGTDAGRAATGAGMEQIRESARAGETPEEIRRDHDLLYGDTAAARVAPYESVHRGVDGLVFGEATLEVRAAYQALSLQAPKLNQEPDDHIGLEFDFMAQLTLQVIDALYGDDAARAEKLMTHGTDFLRDHLLAWAPQMLDLATQHAQTHFMKGVVLLSIGALDSYAELLDLPFERP